ncbi:unnamed protein product [Amoebophrya sp. A25]|nr:unnamed protein product [Amoebophrya sp. A25]|eukprot:GSA25T00000027001.1
MSFSFSSSSFPPPPSSIPIHDLVVGENRKFLTAPVTYN